MRRLLVLLVLLLFVGSPQAKACGAFVNCPDGKTVFCFTLTGQCTQFPVCSESFDAACCSWWDPCLQEADGYCDSCVPSS